MERTENDNSMPFLFEDIKSSEHPEVILANVPQFKELMMQYECAIMEVNTKLHVLNNEFSHMYQRNPIENIETRIKTPASILEKLQKEAGFTEFYFISREGMYQTITGDHGVCCAV